MSVAKVQLTGGNFQDSEGNLLVNGYLTLRLSQDEMVNDSQISSGIIVTVDLDASGNVVTSPTQSVWGNDQMMPVNSFYIVTGYTAKGQIAWGPNNQQVTGNGGTFDVGTWVPNMVINWTPNLQSPMILVNGVPLSSQAEVDFINSPSVTFTDEGSGEIEATASSGLPTPDAAAYRLWQATDNNNWVAFDGLSDTDSGVTIASVAATATTGAGLSYTPSVNSSSIRNWIGERFCFLGGHTTNFETIVTPSNPNNGFALAGWTDSDSQTMPANGNFVGFGLFSAGAAWNHWQILTIVAGTQTFHDLGIAGINNHRTKLTMSISSAGAISGTIDGVAFGPISPTVTATNYGLCTYVANNGGTGSVVFTFEYVYGTNSTI